MFISFEGNNKFINLRYVREIEYNEKLQYLYVYTDKPYVYRCPPDEYKEIVTKIDAMEGVIR